MARRRVRVWDMGGTTWTCIVELRGGRNCWYECWHHEEIRIKTNNDDELIPRLEARLAFTNKGKLPPYDLKSATAIHPKRLQSHSTTGPSVGDG